MTANHTVSIRSMEAVHPHDPRTRDAARLLGTTFGMLMGRDVTHVRIDLPNRDQSIRVLGSAADLHGGQGVCTCCPRHARRTVDGDEVGVP